MRPRFGGAGISGLGTLVSGTYIELDPGVALEASHKFQGLENPPVTPLGVPGLRITLISDTAGSLGPGSSVSYRGIKVGRIESRALSPKTGRVEFGAVINIEFRTLVTNRTRFWNVSGIGLTVGVNGFRLRTGTLDSFVSGGVAFETGEGGARVQPAKDDAEFPIYENYDETKETSLNPQLPYLMLVKDSVRGLSPDAPVEFRGIRVGIVAGISFEYLPDDPERHVPVLIKIDPHLLAELPEGDTAAANAMIAQKVRNGLRATLRTGSLLTGQLFVDLDFQKDAPPAEVTEAGGYLALPTISSGLGELQAKVTGVLDKIQKLNIEEAVTNASGALLEIKSAAADLKAAAASLDKLLASKETQGLPADLKKSLATLNKTIEGFNENSPLYRDLMAMLESLSGAMRSFDSLSSTIERKPSSLLWGNPKGKVSPPKGKP